MSEKRQSSKDYDKARTFAVSQLIYHHREQYEALINKWYAANGKERKKTPR